MSKRPLTIIIMDGFGLGTPDNHNAIYVAKTPTLDRLTATWAKHPHRRPPARMWVCRRARSATARWGI